MKTSGKAYALIVLFGLIMGGSFQVFGQTRSMPFEEFFYPSFPLAMGPEYNGWSGPANNAEWLQNYVTSAWVTYDGYSCMQMRNRETVSGTPMVGERLPTYLISPEVFVSGPNPVISWVEAACTNAWSGPRASPRNLYISVDAGPFAPVDSYTSGSMPNAWLGEGWRTVTYPLDAYSGHNVRWKWECLSTLQATAPDADKWEYSYWCIDNVYFGGTTPDRVFRVFGATDLGKAWVGNLREKVVVIANPSKSVIALESITLEGSPSFSITNISPAVPLTLNGITGGVGASLVYITIRFTPADPGLANALLKFNYAGGTSELSFKGMGMDCSNPVAISPPAGSVEITDYQESYYSYTAPYEQEVTITSCHAANAPDVPGGYGYDTDLWVYSGCPLTPDKVLAHNDDMVDGASYTCGFNKASSGCTLFLTAGQTIYIWWPLTFPDAPHAHDPFVFTLAVTPKPPIDAQFEASQTMISVGQAVNFTSTSAGYPTAWHWDFPGAVPGSSTKQNPAGIQYNTAGLYRVDHTASRNSESFTRTKDFFMVVGDLPTVPIWTEDFSGAGLKSASASAGGAWSFTDLGGQGMNWVIRNTGVGGCTTSLGPMQSTSGGNYLVLPADEYNCPMIEPYRIVNAYAESPSFDCSAFDVVIYEFEQSMRTYYYTPKMELQVSGDGGTIWRSFDLFKDRTFSVVYGDPYETVKINISGVASRQPDVRVRFYWKGSSHYYWMIDDIKVSGIKACDNFRVSIEGDDKVYRGYEPKSHTVLESEIHGGHGPYEYLWSTGETRRKITAEPVETTTYTLVVTDVQGCAVSSDFTVGVEDVRCGAKMDKVLLCRKGRSRRDPNTTVCVSQKDVQSELKKGSTLGACHKTGLIGEDIAEEILDPELLVFPNPSNGRVHMELNGMPDGQVIFEVRDVLGRTVYREEMRDPGEDCMKTIELEKAGIYLITVRNATVSLTRQVAVIR